VVLGEIDLIVFTRRLRDRACEGVPFNRQCFPFRFDDRIGRGGGSLFALDCSQSECMALGVHVPHYTLVSIVRLI
jgi:hypothetical protein